MKILQLIHELGTAAIFAGFNAEVRLLTASTESEIASVEIRSQIQDGLLHNDIFIIEGKDNVLAFRAGREQ